MRKLFWITYILVGILISLKYVGDTTGLLPAIMSLYALIGFEAYVFDREFLKRIRKNNKKSGRKRRK
ncbi:MAG: hypothetical protein J7K83_03175 [Candidatus Aenigmarchaeota archaeon]|nr:hypothetical protein [Candidatus Aenigmarchaeota archaeon]